MRGLKVVKIEEVPTMGEQTRMITLKGKGDQVAQLRATPSEVRKLGIEVGKNFYVEILPIRFVQGQDIEKYLEGKEDESSSKAS